VFSVDKSLNLYYLTIIPCDTKANIVVRIRRRIIHIQIENPSIRAIIPIAATPTS